MPIRLALALTVVFAATSQADYSLNPGGFVNFPLPTNTFSGGNATLVGSYNTRIFVGDQSGTVSEEVYRTNSGLYQFYFQVRNTGRTSLGYISLNGYASYNISVGYFDNLPPNFTNPGITGFYGAGRSSGTGDQVSFYFDGGLPINSYSNVLFIQVNSNSFDSLGTGFVSGNALQGLTTSLYEPAGGVVPEPSSFILCGLAVLNGLGVAAWRRKTA